MSGITFDVREEARNAIYRAAPTVRAMIDFGRVKELNGMTQTTVEYESDPESSDNASTLKSVPLPITGIPIAKGSSLSDVRHAAESVGKFIENEFKAMVESHGVERVTCVIGMEPRIREDGEQWKIETIIVPVPTGGGE